MKSSLEQFEPLDHGLEARHVALDQLARRHALLGRGLLHLLAVLVGAGEEEHVIAVEPHEARDGVGRDHLIGVPDMRRAVGIGDRGRDVIAGLFGHVGPVRRHRNQRAVARQARRCSDWHQRACGFGKPPEDIENQRFAVEIVGLGLARGAVDRWPRPRRARQPATVRASRSQPGAEPGIDGVRRRPRASRLGAGDLVAERMQRARIERRQAVEQVDRPAGASVSASPSSSVSARPTLPSAPPPRPRGSSPSSAPSRLSGDRARTTSSVASGRSDQACGSASGWSAAAARAHG